MDKALNKNVTSKRIYSLSFYKKALFMLNVLAICLFIFCQNITNGSLGDFFISLDNYKVKYLFLVFCILLNIFSIMLSNVKIRKKSIEAKIFLNYSISILPLILISLYRQLFVGFNINSYIEFAYLILPAIYFFSFCLCFPREISKIIDYIFRIIIIAFILNFFELFTIKNIFSISLINSYSPFENELGIYLLTLEVFYLYKRKYFKIFLCVFIIFLSFKRLVVLKSFVFLFIYLLFKRKRETPKFLYYSFLLIMLFAPILMNLFYSDFVDNFFYQLTGQSLNDLVLSRYERVEFVRENIGYNNFGLGSVNQILQDYGYNQIKGRSLHCDFLMLYFDVGLVGVTWFTFFNFKESKKNIFIFLVYLNVFSEMFINHPLGSGRVDLWILMFLILNCLYTQRQNRRNEIC